MGKGFKIFIIIVLIIYMVGTIALKYAAGSVSFAEGVSYTIFGSKDEWANISFVDPYYIGMIVFGVIAFIFSLGNIENSKYLQIVTTVLRFLSIILMLMTSMYSILDYGISGFGDINYVNFDDVSKLFGNSFLMFMCHHSLTGIIYPI